jgi:zinc transport system permease protein
MLDALFQYDCMRNALISGMVIGFIAPLLGVFLVVKRISMIADALSHVTLSGIAFHLMLGKYSLFLAAINPIYTGMLFSVLGALSVEQLRKTYKHYQELAIPIMLSSGIAFGVVFISIAGGFSMDIYNFLFGSILAIRRSDMITICLIGIFVFIGVILLYKEMFSISFDEENARTTGIPLKRVNLFFIIMVALVIASAMRIVGILLVSALMVLPVAASIRIANSFKMTFFYAILFGQVSVLLGLYLSYELNWASGGTIVLVSLLILLCVVGFKKIFYRESTA